MDKMQLLERAIQDKSWVAFLLLLSVILITVCKSIYSKQFSDFIALGYTNKYLKLYFENNTMISAFSMLLGIVRILSISLFVLVILDSISDFSRYSFINYSIITGVVTLLISFKFIIERSIASIFNIQDFFNVFQFSRLSYKLYTGLAIFVVSYILYYSKPLNLSSIYVILTLFVTINVIAYAISLKGFQKTLFGNIFYFILYLCTLEIAPYYFTYYWLTNY